MRKITHVGMALLSQKPRQQSFGCLGIAARLNDFVQHIPVLIDGAPKRAFLAIDRDDGFVQTPHVVPARRLALPAARVRGVADLLLHCALLLAWTCNQKP
jgi:hypothetical protein